jgi:hypothetical protein
MRTKLLSLACAAGFLLTLPPGAAAQDKAATPRYEYAMIKWDGPDKIQFILPDKFEFVRMAEGGQPKPAHAQDEEYYLTLAANKLAREGWEAVNLNSRRILMRRPVAR